MADANQQVIDDRLANVGKCLHELRLEMRVVWHDASWQYLTEMDVSQAAQLLAQLLAFSNDHSLFARNLREIDLDIGSDRILMCAGLAKSPLVNSFKREAGALKRTAILQNLVSLPDPRLTTWQRWPARSDNTSHCSTRSSIAVDRTNVPMLIKGGREGCRWARGTKCLIKGS